MVDFNSILCFLVSNPLLYFFVVFAFAIAVAIVLPIPIEIALLIPFAVRDWVLFGVAVLGVAAGKAVGAWLVFLLGIRVERAMERWAKRSRIMEKVLRGLEKFVRRTGSIGLFVMLTIPFMSDTAVLYFYALFNEEGKTIDRWHFIVSNFIAGIARVCLFFLLALTVVPGLLIETNCPTP